MVDFKEALSALGRGPGFIAVALVEVAFSVWLARKGVDMTSFAVALAAINGPLYGAGAFKAHSDNAAKKNGNGNVAVP